MRCAICDNEHKYLKLNTRHNEYLCGMCRYSIFDANRARRPRADTIGDATNIYDLLAELEERIPGLFYGPECPGTGFCACTYTTGCLLSNGVDKTTSAVRPEYVGAEEIACDKPSNCQSPL